VLPAAAAAAAQQARRVVDELCNARVDGRRERRPRGRGPQRTRNDGREAGAGGVLAARPAGRGGAAGGGRGGGERTRVQASCGVFRALLGAGEDALD
jgi:hypothetical protein